MSTQNGHLIAHQQKWLSTGLAIASLSVGLTVNTNLMRAKADQQSAGDESTTAVQSQKTNATSTESETGVTTSSTTDDATAEQPTSAPKDTGTPASDARETGDVASAKASPTVADNQLTKHDNPSSDQSTAEIAASVVRAKVTDTVESQRRGTTALTPAHRVPLAATQRFTNKFTYHHHALARTKAPVVETLSLDNGTGQSISGAVEPDTDDQGLVYAKHVDNNDNIYYTIAKYTGSAKDIKIPATFNGSGVTGIDDNVFKNRGLTSVDFSAMTGWSIGSGAFASNPLTTITLPNSLTVIGKSAFADDQLSRVVFGSNLTTIGDEAFQNNKLTDLTLATNNLDGLTVGTSAFAGNPGLTSLDLQAGVKNIGDTAFAGDAISGKLSLPDSVQTIGQASFKDNKLTTIQFGSGLTSIGNFTFADNPIVMDELVFPHLVHNINESAFVGSQLGQVKLNDHLAAIGDSAFEGVGLKETLTIPDSVTDIGANAFAGNDIQKFKLPATMTTNLGDDAFASQQHLGQPLTVNSQGQQLMGVRAAIEKQLGANLKLMDPLLFTYQGHTLDYNFDTDSLTLPTGYSAATIKLGLTSGTTGADTDHSGNYGTASLVLKWQPQTNGGSNTTPRTSVPTVPTTGTTTTPQQPTVPQPATTPTTDKSKRPVVKQPRRMPQKVNGGTHQPTAPQRVAQWMGHRELSQSSWQAVAKDWHFTTDWTYRPTLVRRRSFTTTSEQSKTTQQLPQTSERSTGWQAVGVVLLSGLSWLGFLRRQH